MIEIDGPSQAYFNNGPNRVIYQTIAVRGKNTNAIVQELMNIIAYIKDNADSDSILYWRRRPAVYEDTDEHLEPTGYTVATCRLAVYPDIEEDIWHKIPYIKPEGCEAKELI